MPTPPIYNSFMSAELSVVEQVDPKLVQFYASSLSNQINAFRMSYQPQKKVRDLTDWIADIILETSAQGSSLLEVHIVDPAWTLLMRDAKGVSFIDVDDQGFLWPPVEVNFPQNVSDAVWRLCAVRASSSLIEANVILTFEDKIASELRSHSGQQMSAPSQTRAEFIQSLVQQANSSPATPGDIPIRFVALLPKSTFTSADLAMSSLLPASALQPNAPPARKTPNKTPITLPQLPPASASQSTTSAVQGVEISILDGLMGFFGGGPGQPVNTTPAHGGTF